MKTKKLLMALFAATVALGAASQATAAAVAGQIVPVAVYLDLDHPFGLAYDAVNNLIWYTRGDSGDALVHSLKPFKSFTAAELAALPVIGGEYQISLADGQNDVAGTTAVAGGAHFASLAFDCASGQLVAQNTDSLSLKSFDPFTGLNLNPNYRPGTANDSFSDGLDVDAGTVWYSPDVGPIYKDGVLFVSALNPAQSTLPGWSGLGTDRTLGWSGAEQVGNSLFAVAVQESGDAGRTRTIVRFDANTGVLLGYDPDGDDRAARWEDLAFDGKFLYAADLRGDANGNGIVGDIYVFTISGGLEPCSIVCSADIVASADADQCSAVVNYAPSTTGDCSGAVITCTPASGTRFAIGTTTVTCTASFSDNPPDCPANDQRTTCTFKVTVVDTTPPTVTCPDNITGVCNDPGQCSATTVHWIASASDACGLASFECNRSDALPLGDPFPVGTITVTCTATDTAGLGSSCSFTVTVNDCEPPVVACLQCNNPSGANIPAAGTIPPKPGKFNGPTPAGQNPDGFFSISVTDNCPLPSPLPFWVRDSASTFVAGPYAVGDCVKITQAPGAKPKIVKAPMGSKPTGPFVVAHIQLKGDPIFCARDAAGNETCSTCLVPPPPK